MVIAAIFYTICCVLLVAVVLLQKGAGQGLGIIGGSSDTLLGAASGNILTKITTVFAIIFIVGALVLSVLSSGKKSIIDTDKPAVNQPAATDPGVPDSKLTPLSVSNLGTKSN